jgi:cyanophycinase
MGMSPFEKIENRLGYTASVFGFFFLALSTFHDSSADSIRFSQKKGHSDRWLIAFGGGKRPPEAFVRAKHLSLLQSKKTSVLVVPWASEVPQEAAHSASADLRTAGFDPVSIAPDPIEFSNGPLGDQLTSQITNAGAIFFTGGDQTRLMNVLQNFPKIANAFVQAYKSGVITMGTSAGTAFMSEIMLTGNGKDDEIESGAVETTRGIGFVSHLVFDQHFLKRKRQNRLMSLLLEYPHLIGVGVDEDTALLLKNEVTGEALGRSKISVIKPIRKKESSLESFEVSLLNSGTVFNFSTESR